MDEVNEGTKAIRGMVAYVDGLWSGIYPVYYIMYLLYPTERISCKR